MTRVAFLVACVSVLCLGVGAQAAADPFTITDPITITSGSIVFSGRGFLQLGTIAIASDHRFSFNGFVDTGEGRVDPVNCIPCDPGTHSLAISAAGLAIPGTATLDGKTYDQVGSFTSSAFLSLHLIGTYVVPPVNSSSVVIQAPFKVAPESGFEYEVIPEVEKAETPLRGRGIATISLFEDPSHPHLWEVSGARYDFLPTPEPSTLVLVAAGFVALLRAKTRHSKELPRS